MAMRVKQTIVFATIDVGNGNALKSVAQKERANGHTVHEFSGEGKMFSDETKAEIEKALVDADWFVVSLSSSEEKSRVEGHLMSVATMLGVKIFILSDIDGMMHRSRWCGGHAKNAQTITVVSPTEVEWARQYVSPETRIVVVPNPNWISNFTMTKGRDEVRHLLGVASHAKLVVFPGDKEVERNIVRLAMIVKAVNALTIPLHVVMTIHPGADHSIEVFKRIISYSKHPIMFSRQKETGVSTQEALSACDLAIMGNGTANAYTAACLRVPMICAIDPLIDGEYWEGLSGQQKWSIVEMGVTTIARNVMDIREIVPELLNPESYMSRDILRAQEREFSRSKFEGAVDHILALLEE